MLQTKLFSEHLFRLKREIFENNKKRVRTPHLREVGRAFFVGLFIPKPCLSSGEAVCFAPPCRKGPPTARAPCACGAGESQSAARGGSARAMPRPGTAQAYRSTGTAAARPAGATAAVHTRGRPACARPPQRTEPNPHPPDVRRTLARAAQAVRAPIGSQCPPRPLKPVRPPQSRPPKGRVFVKAARRFARGRSQSPASA